MRELISRESAEFDLIALGEVMLRFDPGERRIHTTREFRVTEGGGEYNVARSLRRTFLQRTAIVTALVDNPIGRLIEDLMLEGGLDLRFLRWVADDGIGRSVRNGLNFTERGYGVRPALGCSDRAHTAASQLRPDDFDWSSIFAAGRVRWFHTGGIFAALSPSTAQVAMDAMVAAGESGAIVSYDLNYRASLWQSVGGREAAQRLNTRLVALADVVIGNEEDFDAALGFAVPGSDGSLLDLDPSAYAAMLASVAAANPKVSILASTLRVARSASKNDWGAIVWADGRSYVPRRFDDLDVFDRIGAGDSFAAGLIYGLLNGDQLERAVDLGLAHGALAMTTPGDTSMATLPEVERVMTRAAARVTR